MGFQANILRVMIASPGDVAEERKAVTEEIHRWNDANAFARKLVLLPVKWETHSTPQLGDHPQAIISRQLLDDADIVVGIFGTRIGTPTEKYVSGTVEEIKKHVAAGKTAKIYFSDVPVFPSSLDPAQYASLQQFREESQRTGLCATFDSVQQLKADFGHHLNLALSEEGEEIKVRLAHDKVAVLYNSPRPDRIDRTSPAKLRLVFRVRDQPREVVLPILLRPQVVNNKQWVTLTGSENFQLPA